VATMIPIYIIVALLEARRKGQKIAMGIVWNAIGSRGNR
jgi:hypothetical protein